MAEVIDREDLHRVVATCLIWNEKREFLIRLRAEEPFLERWEGCGGGLELADYIDLPKDSLDGWEGVVEIALRREIAQETGLQVGHLAYIGNFAFRRPSDQIPVFGMRFHAPYRGGEVTLDASALDHKWISATEVDRYKLIGSIAQDIRELDRHIAQWGIG